MFLTQYVMTFIIKGKVVPVLSKLALRHEGIWGGIYEPNFCHITCAWSMHIYCPMNKWLTLLKTGGQLVNINFGNELKQTENTSISFPFISSFSESLLT
jgi:hypothetical protein